MNTNNLSLLEVYSIKAKEPNPVAIQLALIGAMQRQNSFFQDTGDFEFHLREAVIQDVCYRRGDIEFTPEFKETVDALLVDFIQAVNDKAELFGFAIYERDEVGARLHPNKLIDNFNTVLSEVARDLCAIIRVIAFRPKYNEDSIVISRKRFFDSVIELKAAGFWFIGGLFDQVFYDSYYSVPNQYIDHILLGYDERANGAEEYPGSGSLTNSVDPFVMTALENLATHEAGKCIELYLYRKTAVNPMIVSGASHYSEKTGVDKETLLLAASQVQEKNREDNYEDKQGFLEGITSYHFGHILSVPDMAIITQWLASLEVMLDFHADYSVAPFGTSYEQKVDENQ